MFFKKNKKTEVINIEIPDTSTYKPKIDLFKERNGENPLKNNPKFEEWKKRQQNSNLYN